MTLESPWGIMAPLIATAWGDALGLLGKRKYDDPFKDFKKKKPRKNLPTLPAVPDDPWDWDDMDVETPHLIPHTDTSAPEVTAHVTATAGIDQMAANTAFSTTMCCVELGSLTPKANAGSYVHKSLLGGKATYAEQRGEMVESALKSVHYQAIGQNTTQSSGHLQTTVNWADGISMGIGTVRQLTEAAGLIVDSQGVAAAPTHPTYGALAIGVTVPADMHQRLVIASQHMEYKFKNLSNAGTRTNETPVYCKAYWVELLDDVILDTTHTGTSELYRDPINHLIARGWVSRYNDGVVSTDGELIEGLNQPYYINWNDNDFLKKGIRVISSKSFVLANGQVGTLTVSLNKPQVYDFTHLGRSVFQNISTSSTAADYDPVFERKGAQFMILKTNGCVAGGNSDAGAEALTVGIENTNLGVLMTKRYNISQVSDEQTLDRIVSLNQQAFTTVVDVDLDYHSKNTEFVA